MNFIKKVLVIGMFFLSSVSIPMYAMNNFDSDLTKDECKAKVELAMQEILGEINLSKRDKFFKKTCLVMAAMLSGIGFGCVARVHVCDKLDLDFEDANGVAIGFGVGLAAVVWSYVLLKIIDKKLTNSVSDLERKLQALEMFRLLVEGLDKSQTEW